MCVVWEKDPLQLTGAVTEKSSPLIQLKYEEYQENILIGELWIKLLQYYVVQFDMGLTVVCIGHKDMFNLFTVNLLQMIQKLAIQGLLYFYYLCQNVAFYF